MISHVQMDSISFFITQKMLCIPGELAVVCANSYLTYAQLERQANQVAHALFQRRVGPGVSVALCLSLSIEGVISLLAALKAGATVVPLDPRLSAAELQAQVKQHNVAFLLTQNHLLPRFAGYHGESFCMDRDQFLWFGEPCSAPTVPYLPEQPAYLLLDDVRSSREVSFLFDQQSLRSHCLLLAEKLSTQKGKRVTISSTGSMGVFFHTILPCLLNGACLDIQTPAIELVAHTEEEHPFVVLESLQSLQAEIKA